MMFFNHNCDIDLTLKVHIVVDVPLNSFYSVSKIFIEDFYWVRENKGYVFTANNKLLFFGSI